MSVVTEGDPAWAKFSSNLVNLFDPKVQAEGDALRSRRTAYEAQARHDLAKAAGQEDQNAALAEEALLRAGYSPMEIAAIRASRPSSVADIFRGRNMYRGGAMLETPGADPRTALGLLDQANVAGRQDFAWTDARQNELIARDNAAALERAKVGADVRSERPLVLSPGAVAVNPTTGAQIAAGQPRSSTTNPYSNTSAALRNNRMIADLVVANLGGVKKSGSPTTVDFEGNQLALDAGQLAAITNRVAQTYDPATDPDISDDIAAAFDAENLDQNTKEKVRGGATLLNWMGPVKGVKFGAKSAPSTTSTTGTTQPTTQTTTQPATQTTQPATTSTSAPATQPAVQPTTQAARPASNVVIQVTSQADIDNAPSGATLIVDGKPYRKP